MLKKIIQYVGKILNRFPFLIKRVVYILGGASLCLVDQMVGSATGTVQFGLKNYTCFIIAIFILTSYKLKDFIRMPYCIWVITFFMCRYFVLGWGEVNSGNYLELQTNLWCVGIYGVLFIRMFIRVVVEREKLQMKRCSFLVVLFMLLLMVITRRDLSWTMTLLVSIICFYLTNFKEKDLNNLYNGLADGIILGFFIIQIQAWMYRPYDTLRYLGMYSHANMNALFFACAYCAVLGKLYLLQLEKRHVLIQLPYIVLSGLIICTMFFTGARTAFITVVAVIICFLCFKVYSCVRWKLMELLVSGLVLLIPMVVCFLPAYCMLRYIPAYVNAPLFFEADNRVEKIQKGDSINNEKYYELDEAIEGNLGRYFWFFEEETIKRFEENLMELLLDLGTPLQVCAKEVEEVNGDVTEELYVEPGTNRAHPLVSDGKARDGIEIRFDIWKFFINKITLFGDKNNPQGVWLNYRDYATHCHNIFLQMAYDFGIIVGIMFIIVTIMLFNRIIFGLTENKSPMWYYRLFITAGFATIEVVFGMTEMAYIYGQLPLTMFWLVQYIVYHKQPHEIEAEQTYGDKEDTYVLTTPSGVVIEDGLEIIDMDEE